MRRRLLVLVSAVLLAAGGQAARADEGGHHGGGAAPPDDRYECPVNEQTEPAAGVSVLEEKYDYESGRKECVAFYTSPCAYYDDECRKTSRYGSWDPATEASAEERAAYCHPEWAAEDGYADRACYAPGDRGMRWSTNAQGPERTESGDGHHHSHDPGCSQAAQDELLRRTRRTMAKFDGVGGFDYARRKGYVIYPIGGKQFHAFNGNLYDDVYEDPVTGETVQADLVPELPENIIFAMTDDGIRAVGAMFVMGYDEARGQSWKVSDNDPANMPVWRSNTVIDPATGQLETCNMNWHAHTGAEGVATSFDPEHPDESVPMAHVWAWGIDMWESNLEGTEISSWWTPWRTAPSICSDQDACL